MKICVFGAASEKIGDSYKVFTEEMAYEMAKRGHELVFGAGGHGLMGAAARGVKKAGGAITGVIPSFFRDESIEAIYDQCTELIYTDSMRDRKEKMEDIADAFIVVPGGIGTFEEFFEVLTLKQLGRHKKPIAIYNINGYYDNMIAFMHHSIEEEFINDACVDLFACADNIDDLFKYIEDTTPLKYSVSDLKNG